MTDDALRITLIRTSCLLLEVAGVRVLTDPFFHRTMRGLPIFRRPGIPLDGLGRVDVVLASHLHRDHFDLGAVMQLGHPELVVVGTRGTAAFCRAASLPEVRDLWHWEETVVGPLRIVATPAEHTGPGPLEVNYVVEAGPWRLFFGGDARWSPAFRAVAERFPRLDVALLPIGGTRIFGTRTTMGPADAVRACNVLRPRVAVPIHEGGEWMPVPPASWHPGRNRHFVRELALSALPVQACVIRPGETVALDPGGAPVVRSPYARP